MNPRGGELFSDILVKLKLNFRPTLTVLQNTVQNLFLLLQKMKKPNLTVLQNTCAKRVNPRIPSSRSAVLPRTSVCHVLVE
jgi:hypothetical protein